MALSFARPIVERIAWYGLFSIRTRAVRRQQRLKMTEVNPDKTGNSANVGVQPIQ
jgi:hypothetical protein